MTPRPILFMDCETGGKEAGKVAITQLACLFVHKKKIVDRLNLLIKPAIGTLITGEALKIQRRTHSEILGHTHEEKVAMLMFDTFVDRNVQEYSEDGKIRAGGHNVNYDLSCVSAAHVRSGLPLPYEFDKDDVHVCTLKIAQNNLDKKKGVIKDHKLGTCLDFFGITNKAAHHADGDIEATFDLWLALLEYIERKEAA